MSIISPKANGLTSIEIFVPRLADQRSFFRDLGISVRLEETSIRREGNYDSSSSYRTPSTDVFSNVDATYESQSPGDRVRNHIIHHLFTLSSVQ